MMWLVGIIGAAVFFGLLAALRPAGGGCGGPCVGCTGDGACKLKKSETEDRP